MLKIIAVINHQYCDTQLVHSADFISFPGWSGIICFINRIVQLDNLFDFL